MIVVVGRPPAPTPVGLAGAAGDRAALAAAAGRATVQLVARVADDPDGDAMVLLPRGAGVSHVATLRPPAAPPPRPSRRRTSTSPCATSAMSACWCSPIARSGPDVRVVVEAAAWNRAALVVLLPHGAVVPDGAARGRDRPRIAGGRPGRRPSARRRRVAAALTRCRPEAAFRPRWPTGRSGREPRRRSLPPRLAGQRSATCTRSNEPRRAARPPAAGSGSMSSGPSRRTSLTSRTTG